MAIKLLGFLDVLTGLSFFLLPFHAWPFFTLFLGGYLCIKGLLFLQTPISALDVLCGAILLVATLSGSAAWYVLIFAVWPLQKGLFSLITS